ncbi:MAG: glycoside hydrolase family 32 protein [Cyclobacteriaceae bacterium]
MLRDLLFEYIGHIFRNKVLGFVLLFTLSTYGCSRHESVRNESVVQDTLYHEQFRPQYHFTPREKWMNDPNGMVYFDGEYHLFYQHNPDSTVWGPMHWGHAVSKDLTHWEHLPIALYPDSIGFIFSGSAVADLNNSSGFGTKEEPPLVAIFTYRHRKRSTKGFESQAIAYSLDKGRTWIKYKDNPVLEDKKSLGFRDPKVFWHVGSKRWLMVISSEDRVRIYSSINLKEWVFESDFGDQIGAHGGVWECPDLFELQVEGTDISKWVMLVSVGKGGPNGGSATQYFIGDFNGSKFLTDQVTPKWMDYGRDNYAGVTWSGSPDGRKILLGWMSNWQYANMVPTHPWRSAMTIPCELTLIETNGEYQLVSRPVVELKSLRKQRNEIRPMSLSGYQEVEIKSRLDQSEYLFSFDFGQEEPEVLGLEWSNQLGDTLSVEYLSEGGYIGLRSSGPEIPLVKNFESIQRAPYQSKEKLKIHVLMDWSSIELFVDDGSLVMTSLAFPTVPYETLKIYSLKGETTLKEGIVWELKSIWE